MENKRIKGNSIKKRTPLTLGMVHTTDGISAQAMKPSAAEAMTIGQQMRHPFGTTSQLFTVKQFALAYPAFTEPALRNLIFKAENRHSSLGEVAGNGLLKSGAILRLGRKILIDEHAFLAWVHGKANAAGGDQFVHMSAADSKRPLNGSK